jgi:hypothetical protein
LKWRTELKSLAIREEWQGKDSEGSRIMHLIFATECASSADGEDGADQSLRSALMGLIEAARCAGRKPATATAPAREKTAVDRLHGS